MRSMVVALLNLREPLSEGNASARSGGFGEGDNGAKYAGTSVISTVDLCNLLPVVAAAKLTGSSPGHSSTPATTRCELSAAVSRLPFQDGALSLMRNPLARTVSSYTRAMFAIEEDTGVSSLLPVKSQIGELKHVVLMTGGRSSQQRTASLPCRAIAACLCSTDDVRAVGTMATGLSAKPKRRALPVCITALTESEVGGGWGGWRRRGWWGGYRRW